MTSKIDTFQNLYRSFRNLREAHSTYLIAIDGRGGSGKSTIANQISSAGDEVTVVRMDDFYRPSHERIGDQTTKPPGASFDWPRVLSDVIKPLKNNSNAQYRRYDWATDSLAETHIVTAGGIVIVEGCYSMLSPMCGYYDFTIWVECPVDECTNRGIARSGEHEREVWENEWIPIEDRYIREQDPKSRASLVIDTSIIFETNGDYRTHFRKIDV